jgi:hypothetical protein
MKIRDIRVLAKPICLKHYHPPNMALQLTA